MEESERTNMRINTKKTKIMVASRKDRLETDITLQGDSVEQVNEFKFLGAYKTNNGDCTKEIKRRIGMAREKAGKLNKIWKDRNINKDLKVRIMKALVWSIVLYGVEGWTIKKSEK